MKVSSTTVTIESTRHGWLPTCSEEFSGTPIGPLSDRRFQQIDSSGCTGGACRTRHRPGGSPQDSMGYLSGLLISGDRRAARQCLSGGPDMALLLPQEHRSRAGRRRLGLPCLAGGFDCHVRFWPCRSPRVRPFAAETPTMISEILRDSVRGGAALFKLMIHAVFRFPPMGGDCVKQKSAGDRIRSPAQKHSASRALVAQEESAISVENTAEF